MSLKKFLPVMTLIALALSACADNSSQTARNNAVEPSGKVIKDYMEVRDLQFPFDQGTYPHTKGYEKFAASCTICHSLRYIEMQPNFPKSTWAKVVHKMITTYGAPISDTDAAEIVEYLATIKGKPEAK